MKFELAHDSLAQQIYEKASAEAKARRKVKLLVERALNRYLERAVLLTQDDLDEIRPLEDTINFDEAELSLIQRSKAAIQKANQRKRIITGSVIAVLSIFLILALVQWQRAVHSAKAQHRMNLALQAFRSLENGDPSLAFRLAQAAQHKANSKDAATIIQNVFSELNKSPLQCDLVHEDSIISAVFSSDNNFVVTAGKDGLVKVWKTDCRLVNTLKHQKAVACAMFSPDGEFVLSASADSTVRWWNWKTNETQVIRHAAPLTHALIAADGQHFIAATTDAKIYLYETSALQLMDSVELEKPIIALTFQPNGQRYLAADRKQAILKSVVPFIRARTFTFEQPLKHIALLDSQLGMSVVAIFDKHTEIRSMDGQLDTSLFTYGFLNRMYQRRPNIGGMHYSYKESSGSSRVLFLAGDATVEGWRQDVRDDFYGDYTSYQNIDTGTIIKAHRDFKVNPKAEPTFACFSEQTDLVLIASTDNRVEIWDFFTKDKIISRFKATVYDASFSNDDQLVITLDHSNTGHLWNLGRQALKNDEQLVAYFNHKVRKFTKNEMNIYRIK